MCADPVDVASLPTVTCSELLSSTPRSKRDVSGEKSTIGYQINEIFLNSVNQRSSSTANITYQCIKVVVAGGKSIKLNSPWKEGLIHRQSEVSGLITYLQNYKRF